MKNSIEVNILIAGLLILNISCESRDSNDFLTPLPGDGNSNNEWLIPQSQVLDGGPGKDGIPAINNPNFISVNQASYLDDDDLILGYGEGTDIRAYSHKILDWHEIINDKINSTSVSVIYCPLTGTGIGWNRVIDGNETTFGVSGLLYNTNVIPYDRATDSNWSQLALKAVQGKLRGTRPEVINLVETTWGTWKEMYPNTQVVSTNTGHNRNYQRFPYGDYRTNNNSIFFPISKNDTRLPAKERVLTLFGEDIAKSYSIELFSTNNELIQDEFLGHDIVVVGNKEKNFIVSFKTKLEDGTDLEFEVLQNGAEILRDQEGNTWDILGRAISGPRIGQQLLSFDRMIGYWFSFAPFYNSVLLYQN
ncbi:DUF3179 domain-containing protein [Fontibacter flavus]|uniref:DUF3179 domain-containing protein n=1 Tax=Fontibacter flavus TaxID=654838 RepID=A0ABV6FV29_9BACT